ncbi:nucleotidyltransferase domain-containing protein [Solibacillus daqui]|uniref:nucleotidyltransferase domain-containing protein n=1 Tax=Solibacillus daqui TaxID=2912187 RepID=UPI002365CDF4|nr:nucleotidyltransferase domain-containing protein [Solibacillus daqui]
MHNNKRLEPLKAARQFVEKYFPNCQAALLAGSVVRGEATTTSDLDIVIFDKEVKNPYRESFIEFEWPIEVFVHNLTSYKHYFAMDYERARSSLQKMLVEGFVVKDDGIVEQIKKEAQQILENGPQHWSLQTIDAKRYFITDVLDDFIGCTTIHEELFIVNMLAELISEFILRTNDKWVGTSKWVFRLLKAHDEQIALQFFEAFNFYYETKDKTQIITFVDHVLEPFGGRLFEGFSMGKTSS